MSCLLIGANLADNHPILCQYLEANRNKTLIVADPRVTKTAMMADLHLPLKPRSDLALINGIAHILIRYNLIDRAYIDKHTTGFAELEKFLAGYTPERVAADHRSEPGADLQDRIALRTRQGRLHRLDHGRESQHHRHRDRQCDLQSGAADRAYRPRRRRAVFDHWPVQRDGLTRSGLYFQHAGVSQIRQPGGPRGARRAAGASTRSGFPQSAVSAYPDIIEAAVAKKIRALWIIATNPLVSYPNQGVLRHGLSNLDFLVVQDGYHPTPTTELADLVLPAAIWGEKEGTYTNSERRVSKVNKAVEPPGEARSDFDIFLAVAGQARVPRSVVSRLDHTRGRVQRMASRVARTSVRLFRDQLRIAGRARARSSGRLPKALRSERASSRLYADGIFKHPTAARKADLRGLGAVSGTAGRRLSVHPEHRAHRGTLAHAHEDPRGADTRTPLAARVAGNESARCEAARTAEPRRGGRGFAARARARRRVAPD